MGRVGAKARLASPIRQVACVSAAGQHRFARGKRTLHPVGGVFWASFRRVWLVALPNVWYQRLTC